MAGVKASGLSIPQIIERLVEMQIAAEGCIPDGWEMPDELHPDYCELILDMLGVPKDNTLEFGDEYGRIDEIEWKNALESGAMYCRGFAQDKYWGELLPGLIDSEQFVRDILNEM
jgi:hypothetical protein